jgi:O-antigen ligase
MFLYIIRPWETLIPELAALHFERLAYLIILLVAAASTHLYIRYDGPTKGLLGFVAALTLSTLFAYDPLHAWSATNGLYVYLTNLLALILIVSAVRTPYDLVFLLLMAVAVMSTFAGKSLWEFLINDAGHWSMGVLRLRGISAAFGHPNSLAALLLSTFPWWFFLVRWRQTYTAEWPRRWKTILNYCLLACLLLYLACILLSGSRAGFGGLVLFGLLTYLNLTANRIKVGLAALTLGLAVWVMLNGEYKQRIRSIWDKNAAVEGGEESKEGRIQGFYAGFDMFRANPLTGVGLGNFISYRRHFGDGIKLDAHNIPGQLLGETGVIGTAAFVYLLWTLFQATKAVKKIAAASMDETCEMLAGVATAMRHTVILLLFIGLANHMAYDFTWIWLAAFCSCLSWLAKMHQSQWESSDCDLEGTERFAAVP